MKENKDVAWLTESDENESGFLSLEVKFSDKKFISQLFLPKLENIAFLDNENIISVLLTNPSFRDPFRERAENFIKKVSKNDRAEILVEKFNNEIKSIVQLGRLTKEENMSMESARGLFGELLVLESCLDEGKYLQEEILDGWHRPEPAIHDFHYNDQSIEVKTISRNSTTIKISSENQLSTIDNKDLFMKLYRIENINKSKIDSLGDLYEKIKSKLKPNLINIFEIKCAEDVYSKYLGPKYMPLDSNFQ